MRFDEYVNGVNHVNDVMMTGGEKCLTCFYRTHDLCSIFYDISSLRTCLNYIQDRRISTEMGCESCTMYKEVCLLKDSDNKDNGIPTFENENNMPLKYIKDDCINMESGCESCAMHKRICLLGYNRRLILNDDRDRVICLSKMIEVKSKKG